MQHQLHFVTSQVISVAAPSLKVSSVKFGEKLSLLVKNSGKSRAEIARSADVLPATLHNYLTRNVEPLASSAFRIARALSVPIDWLLDDSQGEPVPSASPLSSLSTNALREELGVRMARSLGETWLPKLEKAESMDWLKVGLALCEFDPQKPLPSNMSDAFLTLNLASLFDDLRAFDPRSPDAGERQSLLDISHRFDRLRYDWAVSQVVRLLMAVWPKMVARQPHVPMPNGKETLMRVKVELEQTAAEIKEFERFADRTWKRLPKSEREAITIEMEKEQPTRRIRAKPRSTKKR